MKESIIVKLDTTTPLPETLQIYVSLAQVDLQKAVARSSPADNWNLR